MNFDQTPPTGAGRYSRPTTDNEPSEAEHLRVYALAHAVLVAMISEDWAAADVLVADLAAGGPAAIGPLLAALAGTFAVAVPGLHTPHGVALLRAETQRLATLEADAAARAEATES